MVTIYCILVGKVSDNGITLTCIMENKPVLKRCDECFYL